MSNFYLTTGRWERSCLSLKVCFLFDIQCLLPPQITFIEQNCKLWTARSIHLFYKTKNSANLPAMTMTPTLTCSQLHCVLAFQSGHQWKRNPFPIAEQGCYWRHWKINLIRLRHTWQNNLLTLFQVNWHGRTRIPESMIFWSFKVIHSCLAKFHSEEFWVSAAWL